MEAWVQWLGGITGYKSYVIAYVCKSREEVKEGLQVEQEVVETLL